MNDKDKMISTLIEKAGIIKGKQIVFYLKCVDGNNFEVLNNFYLTTQDKEVQKKVIKLCRILNSISDSFIMLFDSYTRYVDNIHEIQDKEDVDKLLLNTTNLCNSFLDSGKGFVDYLQHDWCKKNLITEDYEVWDKFRKHDCYDQDLSYRVCYYLKNVVEHSGNRTIYAGPLINVDDKKNSVIDLRIKHELIFSDRKYAKDFLNKTKVSTDYWENDKHTTVNQYLRDYMQCLFDLYAWAIRTYLKTNIKYIRKILDYCDKGNLRFELFQIEENLEDFKITGKLNNLCEIASGVDLVNALSKLEQFNLIKVNKKRPIK